MPLLRAPNPAPYTGVVATRGHTCWQFFGTNKQIQTRSGHHARDTISSLQLVFPNWYIVANSGETNQGGTATVKATIEYPVGTLTAVLFSGSVTGSMADGATLVSDPVAVSIPRGAKFFVRNFGTMVAGVIYTNFTNNNFSNGDGCELAVSGLTDKTTTTSNGAPPSSTFGYFPLAIIGTTTRPSLMLLGDSIIYGLQDTFDDTSDDLGIVARSLGPYFGYTNFGVSGDTMAAFISSHAKRIALAPYYSHIINNYGTNDLGTLTAAQLLTHYETAAGYFASTQQLFGCTILPKTTSTDAWATTTNQTTTSEAQRLPLNRGIRAIPRGWHGFFDAANGVEAAYDGGKWNTGPLTGDGIHPNVLGYNTIRRSGMINPGLVMRSF